jgi:hypothetical protein
MGAGRPDAARAERNQRFSISLGQSQREKHDVLRNVVAAVGERRRHVAHRNSSRASVADIDRLYMDAWSLNQTQTRRCIDYLSRYRYA